MAHELDMTTGKAAMAWAQGGATPWHGLGQAVSPDASVSEWRKAAGLEWEALRAEVNFNSTVTGAQVAYEDKSVLYRSDTGKPLSVVGKTYQTVQPADVLGFFGDLSEKGGFQIDTVGSLYEGRRIWALAKVGEEAEIMDDKVAPYLMLATSYDGSMATIAKFTTVRVVCNNTLQACLRNAEGQRQVSVSHNGRFDAASVRYELGISATSWDAFKQQAGMMASRKLSDSETDAWLQELFAQFTPTGTNYSREQVQKSRGYQRVMDLFHGGQLGTGQDAINGTLWGLLNATTQYLDHDKGRSQDNRLNEAWFGMGARMKAAAYKLAEEVIA